MIHETFVEYHIIKNGEGRCDCLILLYRFLSEPSIDISLMAENISFIAAYMWCNCYAVQLFWP